MDAVGSKSKRRLGDMTGRDRKHAFDNSVAAARVLLFFAGVLLDALTFG